MQTALASYQRQHLCRRCRTYLTELSIIKLNACMCIGILTVAACCSLYTPLMEKRQPWKQAGLNSIMAPG